MVKEAELTNGISPENDEKPAVFTGKEVSGFHSILTMVLWLGPIYFNVFTVLASLLFLSAFNASMFVLSSSHSLSLVYSIVTDPGL